MWIADLKKITGHVDLGEQEQSESLFYEYEKLLLYLLTLQM